jgi:general secretion pathway protein E
METKLDLGQVRRLSPVLRAEYLEEHRVLPVICEGGRLCVAVSGTPDRQVLAELGALFGAVVDVEAVGEAELRAAIARAYGVGATTSEELIAGLTASGGPAAAEGADDLTQDLVGAAGEAPVVRLVNLLLSEAVAARASDVHLEQGAQGLVVRVRVDGVLQPAPSPPAALAASVVSRLKIMAQLDIAERRLPQDGRVRLRLTGRELDVRVSTLPTLHGESIVLRLLEASHQRLGLASLGMGEDTLAALLAYARRPQGVLLTTGPTGSGKTTTLYALLDQLRTGREKIISVEDPVEYAVPGVAQVPVRANVGLTFARALRAILRQDPDVLLVGEMRDGETAEICVHAALTGHLVLSTLHTNDAPSALTRLLDLGVADYLVSSTVGSVLAQRLVRMTCRHCGVDEAPAPEVAQLMGREGWPVDRIVRGGGCAECRGTGFRGRTGLYELLQVNDAIREEVHQRRGAGRIRTLAVEQGMRPLRHDGWRQVRAGITTPEEVLRVVVEDA